MPGIYSCRVIFPAEDPVIPTYYIVTSEGEIYSPWELSDTELTNFLKKRRIILNSAQDALEIAIQLVTMIFANEFVIKNSSEVVRLKKSYPNATGPEPAPPKVTKRDGYYVVEIYTFVQNLSLPEVETVLEDNMESNFSEYFSKHMIRLGDGTVEMR